MQLLLLIREREREQLMRSAHMSISRMATVASVAETPNERRRRARVFQLKEASVTIESREEGAALAAGGRRQFLE